MNVVKLDFRANSVRGCIAGAWLCLGVGKLAFAAAGRDPAIPSIFSPASTPADSIYQLSLFVLAICLAIFVVVFGLLVVRGDEIPPASRRRRPRARANLRQ